MASCDHGSNDGDDERNLLHSSRSSKVNDERRHLKSDAKTIHDELQDNGKARRNRWRSIYVMYFTMFLSAITFSITLSSIWPYLLEIDNKNASARFLGWIVAAFSFGQLLASPLYGLWADRRPTREPVITSLLITIIFSIFYSYCGVFSAGLAGWMILTARAMIGCGAGIAAVVRSYVSESTTKEERTGAIAGVSAAQALGFILGPALGLAFVPLGYNGFKIDAIQLKINMYTGPGYLSAMLGIINVVLFIVIFRESKLKTHDNQENVINDRDSYVSEVKKSGASHLSTAATSTYDRVAAFVSIFLFFNILFVFAVFETLGAPLSMDEFAWTKKEAVLYNNVLFAGMAILAILTYGVVKLLSKRVDERKMLMVSLFIIAFSYFAILPMSSDPPNVALTGVLSGKKTRNHSESWIPEEFANSTIEVKGCRDPPQGWCTTVGRIYLFQYIIGIVLLSVGFPAANLMTYAIFSKILGPFPQGTMMGVLTATGSLARGMGPLLITLLYHHLGPGVTFATVDGVVFVAILVLLIFFGRLIPYQSEVHA